MFIRVTAIPAPEHADRAVRATFLVNAAVIECISPDFERGETHIDFIDIAGMPPRGMNVAESVDEIALQLGLDPPRQDPERWRVPHVTRSLIEQHPEIAAFVPPGYVP